MKEAIETGKKGFKQRW